MVAFSRFIVAYAMTTAVLAAPSTITKRSNSKKGSAYNDASLVQLLTDGSWAYNWGSAPGGSLPSGVEYVPMLWGNNTYGWDANVEAALANGTTHLLGFNEPDMESQSNLSPHDAAVLYKKYITKPYKDRATLVSPAVTNGGPPTGLTWMESFLGNCTEVHHDIDTCGISAIALHWYAEDTADDFEAYLNKAYDVASKHNITKIWITEFELTGVSDDEQASFIDSVIPWMDSQDFVERYSYFYLGNGYLTNGDSLSSLGSTYNSAE